MRAAVRPGPRDRAAFLTIDEDEAGERDMPKTLIVPVDGSEAAEQALRVARLLRSRFGSCSVVMMTAIAPGDDEGRAAFEALSERVVNDHTRAEIVDDDDPAHAIAMMAASEPDSVVCMATHGRGRLAAPLLGSVATEVLRRVSTPILLVGPHCEDTWLHPRPRVAACWVGDGSRAILATAKEWADALEGELWLETVYHPLDVRVAEARADFEPAFVALGGEVGVHTLTLRDDYAAGAIVRSERDLCVSVMAMTTHARTGIARSALGSVAMDVVHHSACPVLVVHDS
jgi:nucleotide-binding universal stress UspA family protein